MEIHIKIYLKVFDDLRTEFSDLTVLFEQIDAHPKDEGLKEFVRNARKLIRQYPNVQKRLNELYDKYIKERGSNNTQLLTESDPIDVYGKYKCSVLNCDEFDFVHSVGELPLYCPEHNTELIKA